LEQTVGDKLFNVSDDIRSVMVVAEDGEVVEWKSRTKRVVPREFVSDLARVWVAIVAGLVGRLNEFFGEDEYLHVKYKGLHLYGFRIGERYVVFSARRAHSRDLIDNSLAYLKA
jgi:hypothetical protein